ncbi:DUF7689 domain-containing protein [Burkholderia oklahomensis]|uniref:DUF7689 domain-containing protein n=1 Tax=Burkholderia oklahomensis TaxID=342113 RepID=UPI00016A5EB9|nr:hypothetical protein [Burkholderia oklahomensis]QPS38177.1 hypothetical protein I6G57_04915 [Burkholderia oklahomensis]
MTFSDDEHRFVKGLFPSLAHDTFKITNPRTDDYNCIARAAGDQGNWWWPDGMNYWPDGLPLDDSIDNSVRAFEGLGYERCESPALEDGYEKVVIYADGSRTKHMARQLDDGCWTSKLGPQYDIRHGQPTDVDGQLSGKSQVFLRRRKTNGG